MRQGNDFPHTLGSNLWAIVYWFEGDLPSAAHHRPGLRLLSAAKVAVIAASGGRASVP